MATTRIHWLAPTSSIGALVAGFLFILGHHLFYRSLHDTPVSDNAQFEAFEISEQQINIAVGTAFAFLAKACMVIAISIAFVQIFWYAVNTRCVEAVPTLQRVDAVYSVLDNAFEMLNLKSWYRHPLLMLIAGLAWVVPIASVMTPATLSVRTWEVSPPPVSVTRVPSLDFSSTRYLAQMPDTEFPSLSAYQGPQPYYYAYAGASDDLLKITNAVMGDGAILPIAPPGLNASWNLEFYGPSLECNAIDNASTTHFGQDFEDSLRFSQNGGTDLQYGYVAWFPSSASENVSVPAGYNRSDLNIARPVPNSRVLDLGWLVPHASPATLGRSGKPLEIMILTKSFDRAENYDPRQDAAFSLRRCQLFNATYYVSFDYTSGSQNVTSYTTRDRTEGPLQHIPGVLYKYMNQQTDGYEFPCTGAGSDDLRCCYNHPNLLETLSYQAIMDAFTQRFSGVVYMDMINYEGLAGGSGTTFFVNSTLTQTKLAQSEDLTYLRKALQSESRHTAQLTFQAALETNNSTVIANANEVNFETVANLTTSVASTTGLDMALGEVMEELFRNLTVSLMSSAAFQPNYSSPTAPAPAAVTYHRYHNIYVYSGRKLWLAYGIALALTAFAVVAGLAAMLLNGASYSNNFSTILRAACGAHLSTKVPDCDAHGQDPLPKYLANAKVWLHGVQSEDASNGPIGAAEPVSNPLKNARNTVRLLSSEEMSDSSISRSRSRGPT